MLKLLNFLLIIFCCYGTLTTYAQQSPDTQIRMIEQLHQFYLEKPAQSISNLRYVSGEPLQGKLTADGMRVIIQNYTHRGRVLVDVHYQNASSKEISTSPCFIDPVSPL